LGENIRKIIFKVGAEYQLSIINFINFINFIFIDLFFSPTYKNAHLNYRFLMFDKRLLKNKYIIDNAKYFKDDKSIIETLYKMGKQSKYQGSMGYSSVPCVAFCLNCPFEYDELILSEGIVITRISISIHGKKSRINQANYRMLCALYRYKGEVLSREFLVEYVWGTQNKVLNNVNVMISQLRVLLSHSEIEISTIHGQGYLMLSKD